MADSRPPQTRAELVSFSPGGRVTEAAPNDAGSFMIVVGRPSFLQAKALMKARQWSAAVVAAHAISEVYVLQIFEELMGHAGLNEITFDRCPSMAFYTRNRPLLEWYEKLSGDRSYREQPFWVSGRLTAHVARRHRIAHAGYVCDRAEAEESLAVVDELSSHLEGVLETVKAKPSPYRKPE